MSDAVLNSLNELVSNMNGFYVTVFLFGISILFLVVMLMRDEMWWKGLWLTAFGVMFSVSISYAVGVQIISGTAAALSWIGYLFTLIGGIIFIVGIVSRWLDVRAG